MRSFDRSMPEELNRVLTDHASELLLCSTETAMLNLEREGVRGESHLVGDVMADVSLAFRDIAEERSADPRPARARAGRIPGGHRTPGGQRGSPGAARGARGAARGAARTGGAPTAPAHARAAHGGGADGPPRRDQDRAAARLSRLHEARPARARGADRLGRGPEGGLPARRAVRDAARHHGMGRDGRGGLEHAGGPGSRRGAGGARAPPARGPARAVRWRARRRARLRGARRPTLSAYEDRNSWPRLRRPSARHLVLRGGTRRGRRGHGRARGRCARRPAARTWRTCRTRRSPGSRSASTRPRATPTWPRSTRSSWPFPPRSRATASPTSSR